MHGLSPLFEVRAPFPLLYSQYFLFAVYTLKIDRHVSGRLFATFVWEMLIFERCPGMEYPLLAAIKRLSLRLPPLFEVTVLLPLL